MGHEKTLSLVVRDSSVSRKGSKIDGPDCQGIALLLISVFLSGQAPDPEKETYLDVVTSQERDLM
jgi:hypothetical protein